MCFEIEKWSYGRLVSFFVLIQHRAVGVASSAEGAAVPLMQCTLLVRAGICNLFMLLAIARLLFAKDLP